MATIYQPNVRSAAKNDGYSAVLRETADWFQGNRINITTEEGFKEILGEQSLFETYIDKLGQGLSADDAAEVGQLMENSRMEILSEMSINGIQPVASLTMPTLRKMWVRIALKNAMPTEVAKTPQFVISYGEPYIMDPDGTKHKLPEGVRDFNNTLAQRRKLPTDAVTVPQDSLDLVGLVSGASRAVGDSIDRVFLINAITVRCTDAGGANPVNVTKTGLRILPAVKGEIFYKVDAAHTDGTVNSDVLMGQIDWEAGTLTLQSLKSKVVSVVLDGALSSENNAKSQSVGFDMKTKNVAIGTGVHLNAPVQIEWLTDLMALYNIDGALTLVDIMSQVFGQKLEQEIRVFLEDSFVRAGQVYRGQFDCYPSGKFTGSPSEWREELKKVIDHYALRIKDDTQFPGGKFIIMGNPLDVNIITNVNWVFNGTSGEERGGVEVDFNIGAYSGAVRYEVISTSQIPKGKLRMIYVPSQPDLMTYRYYPYTFHVTKGEYRDPNRPNVPAIMMTKRHTIEEFTPLVCEIEIINNNGTMPPSTTVGI